MKIARLPLLALPFLALGIIFLTWFVVAVIDQSALRGAYQVWQENETFAAATIALLAALLAARPVYLQVRAQSVTAALDLLRRTELDAQACIDAYKMLFEVRQAALALTAELNAYAQGDDSADLKQAIAGLQAVSARDVRAFAERPTINSADRMKIVALASVLSIAQKVALEILATEKKGAIPPQIVARERDFITLKLAGLFSLSSEIAEDLEVQEDGMRARAQELRQTAEANLV